MGIILKIEIHERLELAHEINMIVFNTVVIWQKDHFCRKIFEDQGHVFQPPTRTF